LWIVKSTRKGDQSPMNSATRILDIAERRMRQTGYNAVSYRDIAAEMGIKSASLHYHFPKKEDLGIALVRRYSEMFQTKLSTDTSDLVDPKEKLLAFVNIYRAALKDQNLVCLCAVLGAEAPGLPPAVTSEVRGFFDFNLNWLTQIFLELKSPNPAKQAHIALSTLEGAMIVSAVNESFEIFNSAADSVLNMTQ